MRERGVKRSAGSWGGNEKLKKENVLKKIEVRRK